MMYETVSPYGAKNKDIEKMREHSINLFIRVVKGTEVNGTVGFTRLPFKVPTDPVIKARLKRVELEGKNSFINYLLPLSVIKMKQGVGRLIRKKSDRGIIVILDKRIITKNYGEIFLKSLPEGTLYISRLRDLLPHIKNYVKIEKLKLHPDF